MEYPKLPPRLERIFPDNPIYFITCCTHRRRKLLASEGVNSAFIDFARRAAEKHIAVGRNVIMPDHVHFFVSGPLEFNLSRWVGMLKRALTNRIEGNASATSWQRGFFDHLLRSEESYSQKWQYVRENPVRAGLVQKPEDWPYSGEIVRIDRI